MRPAFSRGASAALLIAAAGLLSAATGATLAATPTPTTNPDITLTAEPLLGGAFKPGAWAAIRVTIENSGPTVDGEVRISNSTEGGSTYGVLVQLASGARQEHFLYSPAGVFGSRFDVSLIGASGVVVGSRVQLQTDNTDARRVFLVADRPEGLAGELRSAGSADVGTDDLVTSVSPEDLPSRVEAWSSIDVLVWHDVESSRLDAAQLAALETWTAIGGDLVIVAGSSGVSSFGAFPADLLPFSPAQIIDVPTADLTAMLGTLPAGATPLPAVTGTLQLGTAIWRSGEAVVVARAPVGQGSVTIIGFDPSVAWLAGSDAAQALWQRVLPSRTAVAMPLPSDDQFLAQQIANLPAVTLPRGDHLLLLIVGYILAIGPLNYVILKRRDRREWAWLTMPITIAVFAIVAFAFGVLLKGSDVIVNELAIVHGAAGADRGLAEVHVGVFSPGRGNFDIRVRPAALISGPSSQEGGPGLALDVLLGDPATVREYAVSYGAVRVFKAQVAVDTPRVDAELALVDASVHGTIVNNSSFTLKDVVIVYAGGFERLGDMAAGESRSVDVDSDQSFDQRLAWRIYPDAVSSDAADDRTRATRRAAIEYLSDTWSDRFEGPVPQELTGGVFGTGPVILAWLPEPTLDIDVGTDVERLAETLFLLPARLNVAGHVVFNGALLQPSVVDASASEAFFEGGTIFMGEGTMAIDYRPPEFEGRLAVSNLSLQLSPGGGSPRAGVNGEVLPPLPADEQPDSEAPLSSNPRPDPESAGRPRIQLFDLVSGTWTEFEPLDFAETYLITDPERYVNEAGKVSVRFVVRGLEFTEFSFDLRIEGEIE